MIGTSVFLIELAVFYLLVGGFAFWQLYSVRGSGATDQRQQSHTPHEDAETR